MNRVTIADRFADIWRRSRADAGKSQEYMAKALGVSRKTIQNWEDGTSCPSQLKGFEWFSALGVQPFPYYLELLYPDFDGISPCDDDEHITNALIAYIRGTTPDQRRKLLYLLYGSHGSSPAAILEMITAHLHTPLRARINVALSILTNYEISTAYGDDIQRQHVQPDISMLTAAIDSGKSAVLRGFEAYSLINEKEDKDL